MLAWRARPPAALGAERRGVEAASFQGKEGLLQKVLPCASRCQGDGTKGWLQGTIVGRLVTVRAAGRQADRAPCVWAWLGWALQSQFPCRLPIPACGLLSGPLPTARLTPCCPLPTWLPSWGTLTRFWFPSAMLARGKLLLEAGLRPA